MSRSFFVMAATVLLMAQMGLAAVLPPMHIPSFSLPNSTSLLDAAKDSLRASARAVALKHVTVKPHICKNGKPLVTCLWDVCEGKCGGANQVCVPDYCGGCNATCVDVTLPDAEIKLPTLPSFKLEMPSFALPKPPCAKNQAINVTAIKMAMRAKNLRLACKNCPAGTVSTPGALACTMCPPGFAADRMLGKCVICGAGTYNNKGGSATCEACPIGSFMPSPGSFMCLKCPKGFTSTKIGAAKCDFVGFGKA
ncbi:MAG: hypothetical protein J3K34DRAFT_418789 [Monoraphidium minutum]|nr:MAG: hypothetical protein J3K34DRAFT_418789 [Monoraphidium minutum]